MRRRQGTDQWWVWCRQRSGQCGSSRCARYLLPGPSPAGLAAVGSQLRRSKGNICTSAHGEMRRGRVQDEHCISLTQRAGLGVAHPCGHKWPAASLRPFQRITRRGASYSSSSPAHCRANRGTISSAQDFPTASVLDESEKKTTPCRRTTPCRWNQI